MARTFGGTTADVVANINTGLPANNSPLTVWTAKTGGTQLPAVLDLNGTAYPGGIVHTDVNGAFGFKINSNTWPIVWVRDVSGRTWKSIADEVSTGAAAAADQFPNILVNTAAAIAAVAAITPVDAKAAGLIESTTTSAVAGANTTLLNSLLLDANVYVPAGVFYVNNAIRIPSNRTLTGAGRGIAHLRTINGVDRNTPTITNIGNTLVAHTTPDVNIYIADLSVDRNFINSSNWAGTDVNEAGSCIQLACVEHAVIERVHARGGHHNFDITASMYGNDGPTTYAEGPSRWVTVRDCSAGSAYDDPFTTHHSQHIRFEDCDAVQDDATYALGGTWTTNSHGFEVDDGSQDCQVVRCYSYGFDAGFQVKSHPDAPPARRVTLEDCVADHTRIGFDLQAYPDSATGELPTDYTFNADVRIIRCEARNIQVTVGASTQQQCSLRIIGYNSVHVEDFLARDSAQGYLSIQDPSGDIVIDGATFENVWSAPPSWGLNYGLVHIESTVTGSDITINNVNARATALTTPIVSVEGSGKRYKVSNVRGTGSGKPAVRLTAWDDTWSVTDVYGTGFTADIQITTGTLTGTYVQQVGLRELFGTAAPTSGAFNRGDRCWNRTPSAAGAPGWMCTTAGTPGTWRAMANLT